MPSNDFRRLLDSLTAMKRVWPGGAWSWDNRLAVLVSSFAATLESDARKSAAVALSAAFTKENLGEAAPALQAICTRTGGLRAGQLLLAGKPVDGVTAYGLWWPWDSGQTITLRLGLEGPGAPLAEL